MLTREQEHAVECLATAHGRVCVREGFLDGAIHATVPDGASFIIDRWGGLAREGTGLNFSVHWGS